MSPIVAIENAFHQLAFAIKLLCYVELEKINLKDFDSDTLITLTHKNLSLAANMFPNYEMLKSAATNNYLITLGSALMSLDTYLEEAGYTLKSLEGTALQDFRDIVYMLRCAFAHNMIAPKWKVRGPYARVYTLNLSGKSLTIDTRALHGKPFSDLHIGGADTFLDLKIEVDKLLKTQLITSQTVVFS